MKCKKEEREDALLEKAIMCLENGSKKGKEKDVLVLRASFNRQAE